MGKFPVLAAAAVLLGATPVAGAAEEGFGGCGAREGESHGAISRALLGLMRRGVC